MADQLEKKLEQVRAELEANRDAIRKAAEQDKELGQKQADAISRGDSASRDEITKMREQLASEVKNLNSEQSNLLKSLKQTQSYNLGVVAEEIQTQNALAQEANKRFDIKDQLKQLNKDSNEQSLKLQTLFEQAVATIEDPESNPEELELARNQIEAIEQSAQTEEERREAVKLEKERNNVFKQFGDKIAGFGQSIEGIENGLARTAGTAGLLATLALLFFDPETLMDGVVAAADFVANTIEEIERIFTGDFSGVLDYLKDNALALGITVGVLALKFNLVSKAVTGISGLITGVGKTVAFLGKAWKGIQAAALAFKAFTMGSLIPAVTGFFSTISAAITPIVVAAAPFIAIAAVVAAAVYALYEGFKEAAAVFESSGSITESIVTFLTSILTAPLRWAKDLVSWAAGALGFEETAAMLDEIDITGFITGKVMGVIDYVKGIFSDLLAPVIEFIQPAIDSITNFFSEVFSFLPSFDQIKEKITGFIPDWLLGDSDSDSDKGPADQKVTAFTTDNELREMAKAKAADSWFTSEDEAFNDLVAQRFEAEDAYVNQDQKEETKPYSEMNDYEKKIARMDRKRAQKEARRRYKGEAGGLEEDRINTSTPMERAVDINTSTPIERAVDPKLQKSRERLRKAEADYKFAESTGDDDAIRIFGSKLEARKMEVADMERTTRPSPVRDATIENQMLKEDQAAAAIVQNEGARVNNNAVNAPTVNVVNTAFVDDTDRSLAFSL